jgi:FkbH-like protein
MTLRQTNLFAKDYLTEEDKKRGGTYAQQRQRTQLKQTLVNMDDFLRSLKMVISIDPARPGDIKRVSQLTQRTNQFNLTTRRYSRSDIQKIIESRDACVYVLGLKDKFGDNGTVGTAIVRCQDNVWLIDTFLMSCRVIGRQAEDALVDRILKDAVSQNVKTVRAEYIKTAKNDLVTDFWKKVGFKIVESSGEHSTWRFDLANFKPKTFEYLTFE